MRGKSSNCSFILDQNILGILCAVRARKKKNRTELRCPEYRLRLILIHKSEGAVRSWKKLDRQRHVSFSLRLGQSFTKWCLTPEKTPPGEPHVIFFFPHSFFPQVRWHTVSGAVARLGPRPWLVVGLQEEDRRRWRQELGLVVVVGPWALRPAGCDGQPLLASLLYIDFCCSSLLRKALSRRERELGSPASPASPGLLGLACPLSLQPWLAFQDPLHTTPRATGGSSQWAHGDPQLCSPALGSLASKHLQKKAPILFSCHSSTHSAHHFLFLLHGLLFSLFQLYTNKKRQR